MNVDEPVMSFLVLSEDSGRDAHDVLLGLTKKLLTYLDPACQTHRIQFEPAGDLDDIVCANLWKNRRSTRVRLHNRIAQKIRNADGFILHHVDADRTWADRTRTSSDNATRLESDVVQHVRKSLLGFYADQEPTLTSAERTALVDARMARYFRLVPYWEIEAWLYQNHDRAAPLCPGEPRCRRRPTCRSKLAAWRDDRGLLDEQEHPSDELCLGKAHNRELLQGYPTADVVTAGKSLAAAVDAMLACDALLHAVQRTHETPPIDLESV